MGGTYESLTGESKNAVDWKAKQNLSMALADGSAMALANQQKFLGNNRESLANNPESLRQVVKEYRDYMSDTRDD